MKYAQDMMKAKHLIMKSAYDTMKSVYYNRTIYEL